MCGRFSLVNPFIAYKEEFGLSEIIQLSPRPDITPGQEVAAVIRSGPSGSSNNRLVRFRWGLVPSWAEDPSMGRKLFNARAETVAEKPSFRDAFHGRRCLIVADGWYEWQKDGKNRIPYLIRLPSQKTFGLAGIYEKWSPPAGSSGQPVYSCTIITRPADETVRPIHDRMPAIIPKELHAVWLDPQTPRREILSLLDSLLNPPPDSYGAVRLEAVKMDKSSRC